MLTILDDSVHLLLFALDRDCHTFLLKDRFYESPAAAGLFVLVVGVRLLGCWFRNGVVESGWEIGRDGPGRRRGERSLCWRRRLSGRGRRAVEVVCLRILIEECSCHRAERGRRYRKEGTAKVESTPGIGLVIRGFKALSNGERLVMIMVVGNLEQGITSWSHACKNTWGQWLRKFLCQPHSGYSEKMLAMIRRRGASQIETSTRPNLRVTQLIENCDKT